ncbi:MAG: hypothetical protein RLO18_15715, partial [Gimesia chilikensis]
MKGLSLRVLTAATALGISPLLLSAQLETGAQLDAGAKAAGKAVQGAGSKADAGAKGAVQTPKRDAAPTPPNTKTPGKALDQAPPKLDSETDANLKGKTNVQTPGEADLKGKSNLDGKANVQTPGEANLRGKANLQNKTDADLNDGVNLQNDADARIQGNMKADGPMRRRTNRPNMDAEGSVQGQVNGDIDPMVREGTAHLDIDEATRARYRYHNGHWWYQTENGQWLFDNNGSWESFDPMTYRNPRQQMAPPQTFQNDSDGNAQVDVDSGAYYYDNSSDNGYYYDDGSYYSGNYGSPYYNNRGRRFNNGRGYYNGG